MSDGPYRRRRLSDGKRKVWYVCHPDGEPVNNIGCWLHESEAEDVQNGMNAAYAAGRASAAKVVEVLRKVEWVYQDNPIGKCPWCQCKMSRGHDDDCPRQQALADYDKEAGNADK